MEDVFPIPLLPPRSLMLLPPLSCLKQTKNQSCTYMYIGTSCMLLVSGLIALHTLRGSFPFQVSHEYDAPNFSYFLWLEQPHSPYRNILIIAPERNIVTQVQLQHKLTHRLLSKDYCRWALSGFRWLVVKERYGVHLTTCEENSFLLNLALSSRLLMTDRSWRPWMHTSPSVQSSISLNYTAW